ncbi:hypothetical protein GCM10028772_19350 [Nocardioides ultimimeridianus]
MWQQINAPRHSCHSWQKDHERMITAMSIVALIIALPVLTALGRLLTRWVRADSLHPRPPTPTWFD